MPFCESSWEERRASNGSGKDGNRSMGATTNCGRSRVQRANGGRTFTSFKIPSPAWSCGFAQEPSGQKGKMNIMLFEIALVIVHDDHWIRPFRNGWKCFEALGVEPVFSNQEQAIDYAIGRSCFRSGEIRILDSRGAVERIIPFSEADRKPWSRKRCKAFHCALTAIGLTTARDSCQTALLGGFWQG